MVVDIINLSCVLFQHCAVVEFRTSRKFLTQELLALKSFSSKPIHSIADKKIGVAHEKLGVDIRTNIKIFVLHL